MDSSGCVTGSGQRVGKVCTYHLRSNEGVYLAIKSIEKLQSKKRRGSLRVSDCFSFVVFICNHHYRTELIWQYSFYLRDVNLQLKIKSCPGSLLVFIVSNLGLVYWLVLPVTAMLGLDLVRRLASFRDQRSCAGWLISNRIQLHL